MTVRGGLRALTLAAIAAAGAAAPAVAQQGARPAAPPPSPAELYEQRLAEGDWVTSQVLTIGDVAYSFEANINGRDDRESALVSTWHGVQQSGDVATVMFRITAMDAVFRDEFTEEQSAACRHLNDGRWWCEVRITSLKIDKRFYLERRPAGEAEPASGGSPTTAPPR